MNTIHLSREEMLARIRKFEDLTPMDKGYPDADLPGCARRIYAAIGFLPPHEKDINDDGQVVWGSSQSTTIVPEGFSVGFGACTPGNGQILHNHDTNETFYIVSGTWEFHWNPEEDEAVELGPGAVISFPPGLPRRFTNLSSNSGDPNEWSVLLAIVTGSSPETITEPDILREAEATGAHTPLAERATSSNS